MNKYYLFIVYFSLVYAIPLNEISEVSQNFTSHKQQTRKRIPSTRLKKLKIESNIINRYARTLILANYINPENITQEAIFSVFLPDSAFITGLKIETQEKQYRSFVEEKNKANDIYGSAKPNQLSVALVSIKPQESNRFDVSVSIEPNGNVTFYLTYEELLIRKNSKYDVVLNIHPGQLVEDLTVDVYISESRPLVFVKVPELRFDDYINKNENTKINAFAKIINEDLTKTHVHFAPNIQQQKVMAKLLAGNCGIKGKGCWKKNSIGGQFVVEYDVIRDPTGGQVLVSSDGYFVHYFSPPQLKPIPKHVIFVLDVSKQMFYLDKVKEAMLFFLDELSPYDYFNIVEFSDVALVWNIENKTESPSFFNSDYKPPCILDTIKKDLPPAFPVTEKNLKEAKNIIQDMKKGYKTNIYDAFITALNQANSGIPLKKLPEPIILFLSTHISTVGEINPEKIIKTVNDMNKKYKIPFYAISFDEYNIYNEITEITLKNYGFVRKIYSQSDIILQLQDFYKTISSPLLLNVKFNKTSVDKKYITRSEFRSFNKGSEIIVAGKISDMDARINSLNVRGFTQDGPINYFPEVTRYDPEPTEIGELEKLWAHMTVKQLLNISPVGERIKKRITDLSLKYGFVTPYTSLVVVKPNEKHSKETNRIKSSGSSVPDETFGNANKNEQCFPSIQRYFPIDRSLESIIENISSNIYVNTSTDNFTTIIKESSVLDKFEINEENSKDSINNDDDDNDNDNNNEEGDTNDDVINKIKDKIVSNYDNEDGDDNDDAVNKNKDKTYSNYSHNNNHNVYNNYNIRIYNNNNNNGGLRNNESLSHVLRLFHIVNDILHSRSKNGNGTFVHLLR